MTEREARDPFNLTADTQLYVARTDTERVLDALLAAVSEGGSAVTLTGPTGLGKTLLLHVLAARAGDRWRSVYLPYSALSPEDLCAWALSALGEDVVSSAVDALPGIADALHRGGEGLLLLVDDAGALPIETARWLGSLAAGTPDWLAVVVAASDNAASGARLAALGDSASIRLAEPMDDAECGEYLRARLALAAVPEPIQARFDDASIRRLYAISGGNPRRLHIAASDLLRGGSGLVPEDLFATADEIALPLPREGIEEEA